jgi:hypothetical protein
VRHVRMLGLCLVAALALAVVAAPSALAGPQWVKCEKVGPGHNYTGPNCTKAEKAKPKGSGEYELYKAPEVEAKRVGEGKEADVPFTGHSEGDAILWGEIGECGSLEAGGPITRQACEAEVNEAGEKKARVHDGTLPVECFGGQANEGKAVGKSEVADVKVTFTECNLFSSIPCTSAGASAGEVKVNPLKGKLGYLSKSAHEAGLYLEPEAHHGLFAEFECTGASITIKVGAGNKKEGAVHTASGCDQECPGTTPEEEKHGGYNRIISPIVPVNQMTTAFTQEYKVGVKENDEVCPTNTPEKLEGKPVYGLEQIIDQHFEGNVYSMWSCAGEELTNVSEPEEPSEIKA